MRKEGTIVVLVLVLLAIVMPAVTAQPVIGNRAIADSRPLINSIAPEEEEQLPDGLYQIFVDNGEVSRIVYYELGEVAYDKSAKVNWRKIIEGLVLIIEGLLEK